MIAKTKAYTDSRGGVHGKLEDAQKAELAMLFAASTEASQSAGDAIDAAWNVEEIVDQIIVRSAEIRDILSTGPKSRPGARTVNRGKKASPAAAKAGLAAARKAVDTTAA